MAARTHLLRFALALALTGAGCKPDEPPPAPAPPPAPPAVVEPIDAGPPDAGPVDAGPPDAGPLDAGVPDAGPPDAGPLDAGPPDAGPPAVAAEVLAPDAKTALQKLVRGCFRQAEKIHWGPQQVSLQATVASKDGVGVLTDVSVLKDSLHDAQSHACFLEVMGYARFTLKAADIGQVQSFTFQHVPKAK